MKNRILKSVVAGQKPGRQIQPEHSNGRMTITGFTLIELMITMAVAGVFLALALPSFSQFLRNQRISTQANEFVTALQTARSEAIKGRKPVSVSAAASAGSGDEWGGGWTVSDGAKTFRVAAALEGGNTLNSATNLTTFTYTGDGAISTGADTIDLCSTVNGDKGKQISVFVTGRIGIKNISPNTVCP